MNAFLWPDGSYRFQSLSGIATITARDVEAALTALFPGTGHAVTVSSGRAGLAMTLELIGLRRPDRVEVPPYASHCVLEAVSRIATPLPAGAGGARAVCVVYHQWGYVQARPVRNIELIEDACDSLCRPNSALFPLGGRFEIWSLPKIIGCASGGVVWCRSGEDAEMLRRLRDARRRGAGTQFVLRLFGKQLPALLEYWAGREALCGYLPRPAAADILATFSRWPELARERQARFALFEPHLPGWLPRTDWRLPCVVPAPADASLDDALHNIGIGIGRRHLEHVHADGTVELVPVLPVPIHQGVPLPLLEKAANLLERHNASRVARGPG